MRPEDIGEVLSIEDGATAMEVQSFTEYAKVINKISAKYPGYIWRGQRDSEWPLVSKYERMNRDGSNILKNHIENFKNNIVGRRGVNPKELKEEEMLALGQHYGMSTPLLDWTSSPYVALFFAFSEEDAPSSGFRVVYGLNANGVIVKGKKIVKGNKKGPMLKIIRPLIDENNRLINQAGFFTRCASGVSVEKWVKENFEGEKDFARLIKIKIFTENRENILINLNRMNINYLTLFPDVYGAAKHCNLCLQIRRYTSRLIENQIE